MNGWQRLWVLISAILLAFSLFIAFTLQPGDYEISNEKKGKIIEFVVNNDPSLSTYKPWELAEKYKDLASDDFLQRFKQVYSTKHPEFQNRIDEIVRDIDKKFSSRRIALFGEAVAFWAGIIALLYALGFSVGWVYRGFKSKA